MLRCHWILVVTVAAAMGCGFETGGWRVAGAPTPAPAAPSADYAAPGPSTAPPAPQPYLGAPVLLGWRPGSPSADAEPLLLGQAAAYARVEVHFDSGCAGPTAAETRADAAGAFALRIAVTQNAATTVSAGALDEAGVWGCSHPLTYVHADLRLDAPRLADATAAFSPSAACPIVRGSADPTRDVALYANGECAGEPIAVVRPEATGDFEVSVCLTEPSVVITASSLDAAGDASACSEPLSYVWSDPASGSEDGRSSASDDPSLDGAGAPAGSGSSGGADDGWSGSGGEDSAWSDPDGDEEDDLE